MISDCMDTNNKTMVFETKKKVRNVFKFLDTCCQTTSKTMLPLTSLSHSELTKPFTTHP